MYSLFEISKIMQLSNSGGDRKVKIRQTAYIETNERSILTLVCDNGYLLFRYVCDNLKKPIYRQLNWFDDPGKSIISLSFDPSGFWLLIITNDGFIYLLPVLPLLEHNLKVPTCWKSDNLTEIKLAGQRALTTVRWWHTLQGQHIAVIGTELGEISFINLLNKKEVGGTYVNTGILALDILYDESHDTTYLLITGNNKQQWRLLLEEKKTNFYWPFSTNSEVSCYDEDGTNITGKAPMGGVSKDGKRDEERPHHLSKFETGTYLTPQCGGGRNLVSAYNSSSSLLQVLEGDLDQMHLFSYKVPSGCENIVLSDKLIFMTLSYTASQKCILKIISRKFAEISENSKKKDRQNGEIQNFIFSAQILAMYKLTVQYTERRCHKNQQFSNLIDEKDSNNHQHKYICNSLQNIEGCLLVQDDDVWECRLRISPENLFLSLTAVPRDLPLAEKLGVMFGLDLHKLYEIAADEQLSSGQFAQAVHLYQLSKCPQLKRVAHFMGYGYLSELIAYIQVLFNTKGVEIVSADKCHFANIALHCFAHQAKEKMPEKHAITVAFKKFLKENIFYDEEVAAKLLTEQGLYDLMYYFAKVRGQHGLIAETLLLKEDIRRTVDDATYDALFHSRYEAALNLSNDDYMLCLTSFNLLQFLAAKPWLLNQHIQHMITMLPKMNISILSRVAFLYDPSRPTASLALKNVASAKQKKRYWSLPSLATNVSESIDWSHKEEVYTTDEDVIKFFLFVLLMLSHKLKNTMFNENLIQDDIRKVVPQNVENKSRKRTFPRFKYSTLSCGQSHVAYIYNESLYTWGKAGSGRLGLDDQETEFQTPQPVPAFIRLQVKVMEVSCGALHSLALTDYGVFGWGSSRYGQLGAGDVQQASQPIIIESLLSEEIISVHCGQYHSLALTANGSVFSWGWGLHGQLGHGTAEDVNLPKLIKCLKNSITDLGAGQGHSVLLNKKGLVFTFGCGMFGQLGTGTVQKQSCPQPVNIPEKIVMIASGYFHVLAVSKRNKIYTWGCNPQILRLQAQTSRRARQHHLSQFPNSYSLSNKNQDSLSNNAASSPSSGTVQHTHLLPNLIDTASVTAPVFQASCGSHHSVLITKKGDIFSWGKNSEGQIGNGSRKEQKIPSTVAILKGKRIVHVACGADFTIAVDSSGTVWGWGQNDNGQIGHEASQASHPKSTSTIAGGRVITIRTNRRMITITQPHRQNVLKPMEIIIPRNEVKISDMDSGSFENGCPILNFLNLKETNSDTSLNLPVLAKLDQPPFGPYALHASLKAFHKICDYSTLLNHCLSFTNFQAAAKLSSLEKRYDKAVEFQLKATINSATSSGDRLSTTLSIVETYAPLLDNENIDIKQKFISHVIQFWIESELPFPPLESLFEKHETIFSQTLCLLLFHIEKSSILDFQVHNELLKLFSSRFCLSIVNTAIGGEFPLVIDQKNQFMEQVSILTKTASTLYQIHASDALTAWDDTVSSARLWIDILHNMQKSAMLHSSIQLTASTVDLSAKSLATEKFCQRYFSNFPLKVDSIISSSKDFVLFSCGHHYTIQLFRGNIVNEFSESLQHILSCFLPQMIKLLFLMYQFEDIITVACPKCILKEIKYEL